MTAPRDCHDCRSAAPCDEHASGAPRPADPPAPKAEEADEATKRDARAVIEAVAAQMSVSEVDALQTFMGAYAMGKADGTRAAEAERDALRARVAELDVRESVLDAELDRLTRAHGRAGCVADIVTKIAALQAALKGKG